MKEEIINLIKQYPRHYTVLIKKNEEMMKWIYDNTKAENTDHFPTIIYSAINNESNICKYKHTKIVSRFNEGYKLCNSNKKCQCYIDLFSENSKKMHASFSAEKKAIICNNRKNKMIEKYGVPYNFMRDDVKEKISSPKIKDDVYDKLSDFNWLNTEYNINKRSSVDIAEELGIYYGTVIEYCKKHNFIIRQRSSYSLIELEVKKYIEEYGVECIDGDWNILGNKEIDIYIPDKKLAIEINGLYWHSYHPSSGKDENIFKHKHITKYNECKNNNIELLQFTDWQWVNKKEIVKSIIKSKLGLNDRVFARKCEISIVCPPIARDFFDNNHLDGFVGGVSHIGLYYDNKLVMMVTVGKHRFNKSFDGIELLRCASLKGITVIGGLSKLINYVKNNISTSIITYCDKNISNGKSYFSSGFEYVNDTKLNYFWTDGDNIISRYNAQKHKLSELLQEKYDSLLTEKQNMFNAGYRIYWGCGNMIFKIS